MMPSNRQSVFAFLNVTESVATIDRTRLEQLRSDYAAMIKTQLMATTTTTANLDYQLKSIAEKFMLTDDSINLDHLNLCVSCSSLDVACEAMLGKYIDALMAERRNARKATQTNVKPIVPSAAAAAAAPIATESLKQIICQIIVKQNDSAVIEFIQTFLLLPLAEITSKRKSQEKFEILSSNRFVHGRLISGCTLDVFIRSQLHARGDTIDVGRSLSKLPLVDPITLVDEFDTWYFDHLRGIFELNLIVEKKEFPRRWKLASDAQLFYLIELPGQQRTNDHENEKTIRSIDRPSTVSLERFVEDVCEKENNGMTAKWIEALRADDMLTFDHLANLKHAEWSELKVLSINGKKILKSYIDREKQMASDAKTTTQVKIDDSNKKSGRIQSESELLACIHQIKLYFHHMLADQFASVGIPTPSRLDVRCVHLSFDEMRREGFADDGLFDQMKMFFLPLTMIEHDLTIDDIQWQSLSRVRLNERDKLLVKQKQLINELTEKEDQYYRHDDSIRKLRKENQLKRQVSEENNGEKYEGFLITELLDEHRQTMERLEQERNKLRTDIQATEDLIENIEKGLMERDVQSSEKTDRDLIKPNRGFIMYGPPGTGKSDIMSKLSVRMGVSMVAPPIAAGELNRPLVGESERIISDICMRCHRTPYLMCCVSIDEIDSLAPKRKDNSSDGNIAKLSVLLSVIDGIKDVPNLMIFCATNRLHMMDEAFLRRMSGKFFVGRPSSHARKSILSGMKSWHIPPHLLESLTMATTNFSGAALRALRRLITVHCIDMQRINPRYQLDYCTMLQLADTTARQYRIVIGSGTLPTLLLRVADRNPLFENNQEPRARFNDLVNKKNSVYTGKIIVNLHGRRIDVEAINIDPITGECEKVVYLEYLTDSETSIQELLERLTVYGKSRNVQLLQLIDLNLLSAESAYDEKEKFEILKERLDECAAYRRSMIVYDLDSLIGINKSEGNSSMGRSTNLSLINHNVYTYVKDKFISAYIQSSTFSNNDQNKDTIVNEEKWSVMVIRDPFLLRQFCDDVVFTRPVSEIEEEEAEMRRVDQLIKCVQCNDFYLEQDNKMGVCVHHDGFVYDNHSLTLTQWGQQAAIAQLLKEEAEAVKQSTTNVLTPEQKERLEREKQRFKYICCNQTVQASGMMGGCKRGKHSPANVTLIQWEYSCDHNREYQDKRLTLLQSRIQ
ncbi:unnamed protein product [Rotaria sordida]|uniref:AAA+ ATPase domain-containing protein n=1 Tax=Rotaria sordida TaxID=392033 RepID=A0A814ZLN8_9BILA|nr:unnamed protein product [Rotaria sordida]